MNILFYVITLFSILICNINQGMQQDLIKKPAPIQNWKINLQFCHEYRYESSESEYLKIRDLILNYGIDAYENKGGIILTDEQRAIVKAKFLKDVLGI